MYSLIRQSLEWYNSTVKYIHQELRILGLFSVFSVWKKNMLVFRTVRGELWRTKWNLKTTKASWRETRCPASGSSASVAGHWSSDRIMTQKHTAKSTQDWLMKDNGLLFALRTYISFLLNIYGEILIHLEQFAEEEWNKINFLLEPRCSLVGSDCWLSLCNQILSSEYHLFFLFFEA